MRPRTSIGNPSPQNRARLSGAKEDTRKALAAFLRVTPEEIVITRNTSESNNLVSNGLELKAGDEVVIFSDNHPSNNLAWMEKAKRFGFTVSVVEQKNPHPGPDYYIDAFTKALTPRTKVLAFTHFTNTVGDLFPAKEICAAGQSARRDDAGSTARRRSACSTSISATSTPTSTRAARTSGRAGRASAACCSSTAASTDRIWPSSYSAYPGAVGISRRWSSSGSATRPR